MIKLPRTFRVRQTLSDQNVTDIGATVHEELAGLQLATQVHAGASIAITVGSRGIANIAEITRHMVAYFSSIGAKPFIVPAMGSHGGGTAEGQQAVIESYGVTEQFCGCPIRSSMETVEVCQAEEGFPVYFDKNAFNADHVVVAGRIKPHTDFSGAIESGLMKMMLIGLGKHDGAKIYHRAIQDYNFDQIVRSVGREVLQRCNILAGVGIIENGLDETAHIEAVLPSNFETREPQLLEMAKSLMPKLPFDCADALLIDEIGKDISGAGMDTNIIGRKYDDHAAVEGESPKIKRVCVRGLTKATHGNATGIGLAEFCRTQLIEQMDYEATRINCVTSGHVTAGMLPIYYDNDRDMLTAALTTIGMTEPHDGRFMWIRNTLALLEVECSEGYLQEAEHRDDLTVIRDCQPFPFDEQGNLPDLFP